jgi:putative ABC transport system ATP-binding protein
MNILGCLDTPTSGEYFLNGEPVVDFTQTRLSEIRNMSIGFIFQGFNLIPSLSALENVELPLIYRGIKRDERRRLAMAALGKVGLYARASHRPGEMSGGQQQRVAIARAIAARPPLILADEPTGNLDTKSGREVIEILLEINAEGKTIILITHDTALAASAQRTVNICDGRIAD